MRKIIVGKGNGKPKKVRACCPHCKSDWVYYVRHPKGSEIEREFRCNNCGEVIFLRYNQALAEAWKQRRRVIGE